MKKLMGIILVGILMIFTCVGCGGESNNKKTVTYADADIAVLMNDLEKNAAAASKNYKGKDVKVINGIVSNIDADGKYFNVETGKKFELKGVQCFTQNKEQKDQLSQLQKKGPVTVYGRISDVGEILGYSLQIDKFEVQ